MVAAGHDLVKMCSAQGLYIGIKIARILYVSAHMNFGAGSLPWYVFPNSGRLSSSQSRTNLDTWSFSVLCIENVSFSVRWTKSVHFLCGAFQQSCAFKSALQRSHHNHYIYFHVPHSFRERYLDTAVVMVACGSIALGQLVRVSVTASDSGRDFLTITR